MKEKIQGMTCKITDKKSREKFLREARIHK